MSNEAIVGKQNRKFLQEKGFFCFKFNDGSRSGIPDMQVSGNFRTLWVEEKYISVQTQLVKIDDTPLLRIELCARDFIQPERMVQMVTMCKFEKFSYKSQYWLYIEHEGTMYIAVLSPRKVWESYRDKKKMKMDVQRIDKWRENFTL